MIGCEPPPFLERDQEKTPQLCGGGVGVENESNTCGMRKCTGVCKSVEKMTVTGWGGRLRVPLWIITRFVKWDIAVQVRQSLIAVELQ